MRIALFLCVLFGISCVSAQFATIQSQLSTNQSLNLFWTCNYPYATATDDQGVVYSSCTGNNGSMGILWTYKNDSGITQSGWVTSSGNGSCYQSWGLSVSRDGNYVYATCYGNPQNSQIIQYERQMNGSSWYYNPMSFNLSNWACGRDILYDDMTEDVYAVCGNTLTSPTRIIRFGYNASSDSYNSPQDTTIAANYIKFNRLNNYLYYATTSYLGYVVVHYDNGSAIDMPNNVTVIPVNGTLTYYCEITSFTFAHNTSNTVFVGCTGIHRLLQSYTSYSILRIDMQPVWNNMTISNSTMNNSTMNNSTLNGTSDNSTMNSNITVPVLTWSYNAFNITWTDSKAQGADGIQDLSYPADGSCKSPSDMEVDSMNQLYVACMQNPDVRSVIRYTPINSTSYLPAYVTSPAQCSHPNSNSLTLTQQDAVIVSCYVSNIGLEFVAANNSGSSSSSSSSSGMNGNSSSSSTGGFTGSSSSPLPGFNGTSGSSSSSSSGILFTGSSSSGVVCVNGVCSSTGLGNNGSAKNHMGIGVLLVSLIALIISV